VSARHNVILRSRRRTHAVEAARVYTERLDPAAALIHALRAPNRISNSTDTER